VLDINSEIPLQARSKEEMKDAGVWRLEKYRRNYPVKMSSDRDKKPHYPSWLSGKVYKKL